MSHYVAPHIADAWFQNIHGVNSSAAVTETSHSTHGLFVVTTKAVSSGFLVQVVTYSYDGVIHTDSFISDT